MPLKRAHPAGDVAAAQVRHEQDDQQHDAAHQADRLRGAGFVGGLLNGCVYVVGGGDPERDTGGGEDCQHQHGEAGGGEPAEESRPEFHAPELVSLPRDHGSPVRHLDRRTRIIEDGRRLRHCGVVQVKILPGGRLRRWLLAGRRDP